MVLGFPSNDFGGQEPGDNRQIKLFCQKNYKVDFPLFSKAPVTGAKIQPLFQWLVENSPTHEAVSWNFEKFLVGRDGKIVARFKSSTSPESAPLISTLEKNLGLGK